MEVSAAMRTADTGKPSLDALNATCCNDSSPVAYSTLWEEESLHSLLIGMAEANGMKNGTLLWPVRIGMAGKAVTPGGAIEIAVLLGREESLRRLKLSRARLNAAL